MGFPQAVRAIITSGLKVCPDAFRLVAFEFVVIPVSHDFREPVAFKAASLAYAVVALAEPERNRVRIATDNEGFELAFIATPLAAAWAYFEAAPTAQRSARGAALFFRAPWVHESDRNHAGIEDVVGREFHGLIVP